MLSKWMAPWDSRVFENGTAVMHTDPLHDGARSKILKRGKRYDFKESELLESDTQRGACRLGSETFSPVLKGEPPANLDTRGERQLLGWNMQAHVPNKLMRVFCFHCPQPPTALRNKGVAAIGHGIAFRTTHGGRKELHDAWVGAELRERFAILVAPLP